MNDRTVLAALLRSDLRAIVWKSFQTILPGTVYLPNWHIDAIIHQLMGVQAGEVSRLLINQPPRSLKSISVSVAYVAWLLGRDPPACHRRKLFQRIRRRAASPVPHDYRGALVPGIVPGQGSNLG